MRARVALMRERATLFLVLVLGVTACGSELPERLSLLCVSETACGYFPDYDACLRGHPIGTYATPLRTTYHRDVDARCFEAAQSYGCYQRGVPYPGDTCCTVLRGKYAMAVAPIRRHW